MKRIILILAAVAICTVSRADDRSAGLLKKLAATMSGYKSYRVEFSLKTDPSARTVSGSYIVSGTRYRLTVEDRDVFCDGTTRYEVNATDKEIAVDKVNAKDKSILSNPTRVFDFSNDVFDNVYSGKTTAAGKSCDLVTLTPKARSGSITKIALAIDSATGLPVSVTYTMDGVSQPVTIEVKSIKKLAAAPDADLRFDRSKYKGFDMVDFR